MQTGNLAIDGARLWSDLMATARIGGTARGGIRRLALSDEDRRVRDWFRQECEAAGCRVTVDEVGNMFARRPGRADHLAPIAMGSHLDTQPTGGRFDGILGVLAGLECLRTLHEADYVTHAPLMLVCWTNEEGARFAPAMLGSGVHAGVFDTGFAETRLDTEGVSFGEALSAIGYRGDRRAGEQPIGAMFELHIEQGPILEDEGFPIGVVRGVQGIRWYDVTIEGRESHAGTTPMRARRDALTATARLLLEIDTIARAEPEAVATVGTLDLHPASRNVIPGRVVLSLDLRHPDAGELDALQGKVEAALARLAAETGVATTMTCIWNSPPVAFDAACLESIRRATQATGHAAREIVSGAGHDAVYVARVAPTAMIFVPCAEGLSHNEAESATPEACSAGAQVLLQAILDYDHRLSETAATG